MRTYGRRYSPDGSYKWTVVETDPATGSNDAVWLTTLLQCLQLNLGESPFYADYGISAMQSVIQQLWPDYDVARTQQQFAGYFAALIITRVPGASKPTYKVNVTTHQGVKITATVAQ
jgi:hypothetical protein